MFVNNEKFALHDDVIFIALKEFFRSNSVIEITNHGCIDSFIKVLNFEKLFYFGDSLIKHANSSFLLIDFIMSISNESTRNIGELYVPLCGFIRGARNNKRSTSFINQN